LATAFLFPPYTPLNRILVALLFVMLAGGYDFGGILRHRGMKMLGDMSYSIYLMHGVVLYSVFALGGWFDFQAHGLLVYIATFPLIFVLVGPTVYSCVTVLSGRTGKDLIPVLKQAGIVALAYSLLMGLAVFLGNFNSLS